MKPRLLLIAFLAAACSSHQGATTTENEPTTVVSLTFDDTREDQFQVGAMVAARQMRATFYVNSPRIGRDGYMTLDQLRTLASDGNEIAGHTLAHVHLAELDSIGVQREICDDRVALLNLGFDVTTFAYPWGSESPGIQRIAKLCGYNAARDSSGLAFAATKCTGCPHANAMKPEDPYLIKAVGPIAETNTLAELQQAVIDAENAGGGWVPFVFHHVCDGCSTNAVSPATLSAFIDWLAERKATGTGVKTVAEVIGGSVQAAVPAPPPGVSANLIENASFERDEDGNEIPDCWQRRASGTNEAVYSFTDAAYDGAVAQTITITSYTDGTRRLLTRQECPLPAQPGHSYRISSWYIADTPPRYSVYYRTASGSWMSLEQGEPLPVSPVYVQGVHTTPPLPGDATALSVGIGIGAVGSITMDAFDAVDASAPVGGSAPAVALMSPADGAAVSSTVTIAAAASDPDGIDRVDFRINDLLEEWDDSEPFETSWNTARLGRGSYVITARAFDRTGNVTTSLPITVTVGGGSP